MGVPDADIVPDDDTAVFNEPELIIKIDWDKDFLDESLVIVSFSLTSLPEFSNSDSEAFVSTTMPPPVVEDDILLVVINDGFVVFSLLLFSTIIVS